MTTHAPIRISGIRYLAADWHTRLFGPDHHGATDTWLHTLRTLPTHTPVIDRPAITAQPHREINDPHLGRLYIAGHVDAHLYNALVNAVNTEVTL